MMFWLCYLHPDLLVHARLLLFYLLLELLDGRSIWCGTVSLENLDIPKPRVNREILWHCVGRRAQGQRGNELISEGCDLLLLDLVVGKVLLILLPVRTGSGRLWMAVSTSENGGAEERAGKGSSYHRDDLSRDGIPHATGSLIFGWQKAMDGEMKISIVY